MPLYNFDSLDKILNVVYLEGTILEIDPITETAKVWFEDFPRTEIGSFKPIAKDRVPFYYHCYSNAKRHHLGGLTDGYIPFKKGDKVIVACSLPDPTNFSVLQPIHIIAFSSDRKPCFFVYFVELRELSKGWALIDVAYGRYYKLKEDNRPEFYPFVVVKTISIDPPAISTMETSYYQVVGLFNSEDDPFCRWKLYYLPDDLPISALVHSSAGYPLGKLKDFGQAVLSRAHSLSSYPFFSTKYLNFSFGEGELGKIFGVFSRLGCCYVDRVPTYFNTYFGACGFNRTHESRPQRAFFLTSSKVLGSTPASQQLEAAGSRWSKKPMSISSRRIADSLYRHVALAEGGNSVIYTDSRNPWVKDISYFPFAALGKNQSIYTKRTVSYDPVGHPGEYRGGHESPSTGFAPKVGLYYRAPDYTLIEEIYIGNARVVQCQSTPPTVEYVSPLYYDGFLRGDNPYAILFYSKHRVETEYSRSSIIDVHAYEFYVVCMFDGTVTLHEQIGQIQGTYTTTPGRGYRFTPSHGTIPTCVSCQISHHAAVYTYLEYSGLYPESLEAGVHIYLTGQNRVIGIASPPNGHKVYKDEDAKKILKNMVKSEYKHGGTSTIFEQDFSIDPTRNIAIGMFPCLRWGDK